MAKALSWAAVGGGEGGAPFFVLGAVGVVVLTAAEGPAVAAELDAETPVVLPVGAAAGVAAGLAAEAAGVGAAACPDAETGSTTPASTANSAGKKA